MNKKNIQNIFIIILCVFVIVPLIFILFNITPNIYYEGFEDVNEDLENELNEIETSVKQISELSLPYDITKDLNDIESAVKKIKNKKDKEPPPSSPPSPPPSPPPSSPKKEMDPIETFTHSSESNKEVDDKEVDNKNKKINMYQMFKIFDFFNKKKEEGMEEEEEEEEEEEYDESFNNLQGYTRYPSFNN